MGPYSRSSNDFAGVFCCYLMERVCVYSSIGGFQQTTRVLAEEQFTKRALVEKIRAGISPAIPDGAAAWSGGLSQPWR